MGCVHDNHMVYPGGEVAVYQEVKSNEPNSELQHSRKLDSILRKASTSARGINKLLILGSGAAGKV